MGVEKINCGTVDVVFDMIGDGVGWIVYFKGLEIAKRVAM